MRRVLMQRTLPIHEPPAPAQRTLASLELPPPAQRSQQLDAEARAEAPSTLARFDHSSRQSRRTDGDDG
jgi:hypothetical protein